MPTAFTTPNDTQIINTRLHIITYSFLRG